MNTLFLIGIASYYSIAGCLGCNPNFTMANGQRFDDTKMTVAYNEAPLNSYIGIINLDNLKWVIVPVTDRGGFEKLGRIADLSLATKEALGCSSLCRIEVVR